MTVTLRLQLGRWDAGDITGRRSRSKRRQHVGRAVFVTAAGPAAAG